MLKLFNNRTYRHLFAAQVVALLGTGLATVALGLLAYDLAGANAGAVLGTAFAIKMIAYVGVSPIASAFAERLPRRSLLIALDIVRATIVLALPFVDQIWQIYALIFLLQSASAAFTPTFQATIPDILPDEAEYTKALSLSRLAYDLENLISPMLAAAMLALISFHWLFAGTAIGFALRLAATPCFAGQLGRARQLAQSFGSGVEPTSRSESTRAKVRRHSGSALRKYTTRSVSMNPSLLWTLWLSSFSSAASDANSWIPRERAQPETAATRARATPWRRCAGST
jgi:MFS family permease